MIIILEGSNSFDISWLIKSLFNANNLFLAICFVRLTLKILATLTPHIIKLID